MKIGLTLYMEQLINPSKSFTIKENVPVMQYFGLEDSSDIISETESKLIPNSNSKTGDINSINTDTMDVEVSLDTSSKKQVVEEDFSMQEIKVEKDNLMDNSQLGTLPLCRLCAQEIYDEELAYIHETITDDGLSLAEKINACLPITVTLKDTLPKQICSECLVNLESSYNFSSCVTSAEERLVNLQYRSKGDKLDCPMCCEGNMETTLIGDEDREEIGSDNTSFLKAGNDESNELASFSEKEERNEEYHEAYIAMYSEPILKQKRGRPRKNEIYTEDDKDWCFDDEVEPVRKKTSNRGRPKGSKNKISKPKSMDCFICHLKLKDLSDALSHALEAHCNSENQTFPCPLCQSISISQPELSQHMENHSDFIEVVVLQCLLCDKEYRQVGDLQKHVQDEHMVTAEMQLICPICECLLSDSDQLADHVMQNHVSKEQSAIICPVCASGFTNEMELKLHFSEKHTEQCERIACSECSSKLNSLTEYVSHIIEQHCSTPTYKVPSTYNCAVCKNNFRSQFSLIKHTCSVFFEELYCRECDKGFPTKARLVLHLQTHQQMFAGLRCDTCWASFNDEDSFYDHVRFKHEPDEQTECSVCNKVFKNSTSLGLHMRRHEASRDHECLDCGKRFQNAQTLREHQVSHMSVKPYQCHICGAYLSRLSRLRIHLRTHSVKSSKASMIVHKCSLCCQLFPNSDDASKHIEDHVEVENIQMTEVNVSLVYRCEYCDACFQVSSELNEHRRLKHPDPEAADAFTCSVCGAQFSTFARVTTHKLTHGINLESLIVSDEVDKGERGFVVPQFFLCHECDKKCLHYTYMNLHRRFHHAAGKPIFTCLICKEKFCTSWSLEFHKKKQHNIVGNKEKEGVGPSTLHCKFCDKPYMTETSLELHVRRCHQNGDGEDDDSNFICDICGKTFQFKTMLEAHVDAHKGMKRYECTYCDKRFTHRAGLVRHLKLHSSEDPFVCEYCGKKFRDRSERENHRRAHTGERPFMCDVCGRTFHTRSVWLDHSRIHEDVRPYQCYECGQSFRRSYALKNHFLIHTGEKPFFCEICCKSFRMKHALIAHTKKDHQKVESVSDNILPQVLLIETNSQYEVDTYESAVDDPEIVENGDNPGAEGVDDKSENSSVWTSTNVIKIKSSGTVGSGAEVGRTLLKNSIVNVPAVPRQGYSLLLKPDLSCLTDNDSLS